MSKILKKTAPASLIGLVILSASVLSGAGAAVAGPGAPTATAPAARPALPQALSAEGLLSRQSIATWAPGASASSKTTAPEKTADAGRRLPLDPSDPAIQGEKMPAGQGLPDSAQQFAVPGSAGSFKFTRPVSGGTSTGAVQAGLDEFYAQKVSWGSCTPFDASNFRGWIDYLAQRDPSKGLAASCAYVIVPVDYKNPSGPTAAIAVAKASTGLGADGKPKHALFGNAGGPGQPSLPFTGQWAGQYRNSLADYDIVGVDTRGAGASLPQIRCATDKFLQAQSEGMDGLASTTEGLARLDQINRANTEACYTNTGLGFLNPDGTKFSAETYLPKVSVDDEARDMDVIRSVLGNAKLSYQGGSDGTGVGYTYAQEFPESTRAMILDSPENPFENNPAEAAKFQDITGHPKADPYAQDRGFQDTFNQFAAKCAQDDGFDFGGTKVPCALGTNSDRATLIGAYQAIAQKAFGGTTYYSDSLNRPLSFKDFTQATTGALYGSSNWAQLNAGLAAAKEGGDVKDLFELSDGYYSWDGKSSYPFFVVATFPTIACQNFTADATDITAKGSYAAAPYKNPGNDAATGVQRDGLDSSFGWCDFYHTKNQKALAQSVKALPNILVVRGGHDPATPYVGGVVMAKGLGASLLTVENPQHIALGRNITCANQIAETYLKDLTVRTDLPGKTGIQVLDLSQRPIDMDKNVVGNQCRVDTANRPVPTVAPAAAVVGAKAPVQLTASGLVRGAAYRFALTAADGSELPVEAAAKQYPADADGRLQIPVTLPASLNAGQYGLALVGTEDVNRKIPVAPGVLTVTKAPPVLNVVKPSLPAGTEQTVTGSGFDAGSVLALQFHSTPVDLGNVTVGADGTFSKSFAIPEDAEPGSHKIVAVAADGTAVESGFQVTAKPLPPVLQPTGSDGGAPAAGAGAAGPNPDLAVTGAGGTVWAFGGIGTAMLLLGGLAMVLVRRSRGAAA